MMHTGCLYQAVSTGRMISCVAPGAKGLKVPQNGTLVPLPPYSPDLNSIERVWLYLRERYLSHRLLANYEAVVTACCDAWNALTAEAGRLRSLTTYPYLKQIKA
jgi:transposase